MVSKVVAENLRKIYPNGTEAVKGISFELDDGVYAFMGPNGSGKTTTLSMLAGSLKPTEGRVIICGYNIWGSDWLLARKKIGFAPQDMPFRKVLTGFENIVWYGLLKGLSYSEAKKRAKTLLEELGLWEHRKKQVSMYSGGMRRRLIIAAALISDPEVLILDEPSSGLDPAAREEFWGILRRTIRDGRTVIYSTHIASEAEKHSDEVYIFNEGQIIAKGTAQELIEKYAPKTKILVEVPPGYKPIKVDDLEPEYYGNNVYAYVFVEDKMDMKSVVGAYEDANIPIVRIEVRRPGLEEVFLVLAGRRLEGD